MSGISELDREMWQIEAETRPLASKQDQEWAQELSTKFSFKISAAEIVKLREHAINDNSEYFVEKFMVPRIGKCLLAAAKKLAEVVTARVETVESPDGDTVKITPFFYAHPLEESDWEKIFSNRENPEFSLSKLIADRSKTVAAKNKTSCCVWKII
ncbi:hypothetical protein HN954_03265 [bacterium]|jgi:hypothetical protein|nr:hypothetical protein [bacterium]MBT6832131.1 hypothetical protein [bacterium]MBT6996423.1 hypothetical protein [bacterium]MBT7772158.1 hypothetical protein [bacterium]